MLRIARVDHSFSCLQYLCAEWAFEFRGCCCWHLSSVFVVGVAGVWAGVIDLILFFIHAIDSSPENYSIIDSMNSDQCQWLMGHSGDGPGYQVSK